ncbi:MAG: DUF3800 domain-containing protein [Elusimicrobia bacterium]|nr:DUF3800 domain-containing protein [Elusimicrobiota bacterium]
MYFTFLDDSKQNHPTRHGMSSLISVGGVILSAMKVKTVENEIEQLCRIVGFPEKEEFKWSPGRELWMHDNLTRDNRQEFFQKVLNIINKHKARIVVVIEDTSCRCATNADNAELDIITLILERIEKYLILKNNATGIIIIDRPSGNRKDEDIFLFDTLDTLQRGTGYVMPEHICFNVLSTPSKFVRLLQVADFVNSCSLAYISGESTYSPVIFDEIKPLLCSYRNRIGGIGVKLHPCFKYANLYHWLLGDTHLWKMGIGHLLPLEKRPYFRSQNDYFND